MRILKDIFVSTVGFAFVLSAFLFCTPPAHAQVTTRFCSLGTDGKVLDDIALNAAAGTRTFTFGPRECTSNVANYNWLVVEMEFTYSSKAGNVLLTCLTGRNVANADKAPQVCVGAGTCTAVDGGIVTKAVTGNKKWKFRIGLRGYRAWSCVASHDNSPTASEKLTTYAYLTD